MSRRWAAARSWGRRLSREVAQMPETLAAFREGVESLQTVARRLETSTVGLERATVHLEESGVTEALRNLDQSVGAVNRQLASFRDLTGLSTIQGLLARPPRR